MSKKTRRLEGTSTFLILVSLIYGFPMILGIPQPTGNLVPNQTEHLHLGIYFQTVPPVYLNFKYQKIPMTINLTKYYPTKVAHFTFDECNPKAFPLLSESTKQEACEASKVMKRLTEEAHTDSWVKYWHLLNHTRALLQVQLGSPQPRPKRQLEIYSPASHVQTSHGVGTSYDETAVLVEGEANLYNHQVMLEKGVEDEELAFSNLSSIVDQEVTLINREVTELMAKENAIQQELTFQTRTIQRITNLKLAISQSFLAYSFKIDSLVDTINKVASGHINQHLLPASKVHTLVNGLNHDLAKLDPPYETALDRPGEAYNLISVVDAKLSVADVLTFSILIPVRPITGYYYAYRISTPAFTLFQSNSTRAKLDTIIPSYLIIAPDLSHAAHLSMYTFQSCKQKNPAGCSTDVEFDFQPFHSCIAVLFFKNITLIPTACSYRILPPTPEIEITTLGNNQFYIPGESTRLHRTRILQRCANFTQYISPATGGDVLVNLACSCSLIVENSQYRASNVLCNEEGQVHAILNLSFFLHYIENKGALTVSDIISQTSNVTFQRKLPKAVISPELRERFHQEKVTLKDLSLEATGEAAILHDGFSDSSYQGFVSGFKYIDQAWLPIVSMVLSICAILLSLCVCCKPGIGPMLMARVPGVQAIEHIPDVKFKKFVPSTHSDTDIQQVLLRTLMDSFYKIEIVYYLTVSLTIFVAAYFVFRATRKLRRFCQQRRFTLTPAPAPPTTVEPPQAAPRRGRPVVPEEEAFADLELDLPVYPLARPSNMLTQGTSSSISSQNFPPKRSTHRGYKKVLMPSQSGRREVRGYFQPASGRISGELDEHST